MPNFFRFRNSKIQYINSPLSGNVVNLEDVPDKVFADKLVGDGIAIEPEAEWLLAPVAGTIVNLSATKHAIGIVTKKNLEVLVHLGIDTVELNGAGFESVVKEGQKVNPGDKLIRIDWSYIKDKVPSIISPIIITNMDKVASIHFLKDGAVNAGEILLSVKLK